MVRYFSINGVDTPADFSIRTLAQLAREYKTDITGLFDVFQNFADEADYIDAVAKIGMCALNVGAQREGLDKTYTVYDVYDILTRDMALAEQFLNALFESMQGDEVFTKPPKKTKVAKVAKKTEADA